MPKNQVVVKSGHIVIVLRRSSVLAFSIFCPPDGSSFHLEDSPKVEFKQACLNSMDLPLIFFDHKKRFDHWQIFVQHCESSKVCTSNRVAYSGKCAKALLREFDSGNHFTP